MNTFSCTKHYTLPDVLVDTIRALVYHHRKVTAIRLLRHHIEEQYGWKPGLREAKHYCDQFPQGPRDDS